MKISHFSNEKMENSHIFLMKVRMCLSTKLPPALPPFCNYPSHRAGSGGGF